MQKKNCRASKVHSGAIARVRPHISRVLNFNNNILLVDSKHIDVILCIHTYIPGNCQTNRLKCSRISSIVDITISMAGYFDWVWETTANFLHTCAANMHPHDQLTLTDAIENSRPLHLVCLMRCKIVAKRWFSKIISSLLWAECSVQRAHSTLAPLCDFESHACSPYFMLCSRCIAHHAFVHTTREIIL